MISGISQAEQVKQLIAGGAEIIQLREKRSSPNEFYESAKLAVEVARHYKVKIIINDRVDVALALKADGVHLGQADLSPESARAILGERAIIGYSTHTLGQALDAIKLPIDYVACGPVFETNTKVDPDATVGIQVLKLIRNAIGDFPLVAIGGINTDNVATVLNSGADSAAVIGSMITGDSKIEDRMRLFLTIVGQNVKCRCY